MPKRIKKTNWDSSVSHKGKSPLHFSGMYTRREAHHAAHHEYIPYGRAPILDSESHESRPILVIDFSLSQGLE